jgi:LmbE family N-acetylglucosaminyl deacetylase
MQKLTLSGPIANVLALGAHSDDIEIGAGGTIRWLLQSTPAVKLHWVVFAAAGARAVEAEASATSILGKSSRHTVRLFDFRDGFFPYDGARLKETFERIKAECQPDLVLCHDRDDLHQDHRVVGELAWNTFRDHLILEYEVPKYDGGLRSPNLFVPLPEALVEEKVAGLMRHFASQRAKQWFTEDTFRALMRLRGVECRSKSGYAEGFQCRKAIWDLEQR